MPTPAATAWTCAPKVSLRLPQRRLEPRLRSVRSLARAPLDSRTANPASPTFSAGSRCDDQPVALSVLIVDDDPGFLGLTARILVELGAEPVWTAATAARALELVQGAQPDAALVDIGLPDRHGIDLAYELAELPWRPRVVLTSSDSDAILALDSRDGGRQFQFLAKEELESDTLQEALLDG